MFTVTQSKMWGNTFWPGTLAVSDTEVTITGRKPIILWFTRPYEHAFPLRQVASVNLDKGVATSTIRLQTTGGAMYEIKALPHDGAAQAVALIRDKVAQVAIAR